jgi:hypothetical protein
MKIKHWEVKEDLGDFYVVDEDGENVALAQRVYPEAIIHLDEKDAHLIAAAPEMLDLIISEFKCHRQVGITDELYEWNRLALALIEKATGLTIGEVLKTD